jgi:hypothetical protein
VLQTSFSPNFLNKTTSAAKRFPKNQSHYLINFFLDEVMRLVLGRIHWATEVVLLGTIR